MTRAGLIAFSMAALTATSLAVAQVPTSKVATPSALVNSEVTAPVAVVTSVEVPVAKAMAIQIAPSDVKPVAAVETPAVVPVEAKAEIVEAPKPPAPPAITLVAKVDLAAQKVTVLEHGKAKYTWTISSGTRGHDTPRGTFQPEWMAKMWYSKKYDNSPMPHSVFFKEGAAFHATQWTGQLGRPASHGCVRLTPANAAKFYALVASHGMKHTRISVFGAPRHAPDMVASRTAPQSRSSRIVASSGGYRNGVNNYSGNYNGYSAGNGSAFVAKPIAYRPQAVQVRVVQYPSPYGSRGGVRY